MSYDLQVGKVCPHRQMTERSYVDPFDMRSLRYGSPTGPYMRAPVNGEDSVEVRVRGVLVSASDPVWGYSLIPDTSMQSSPYAFRIIRFHRSVRAGTSLIEVSYNTVQEFCLLCGTTGNAVDWNIGPSGSLSRVTQITKLMQQVNKYLLTSNNPFDRNLQCALRTYIGSFFGVNVTDADISNEVIRILGLYRTIQRNQSTVQTLDIGEVLKDISGVTSEQDLVDPNIINTSVGIIGYVSDEPIPLAFSIQGRN